MIHTIETARPPALQVVACFSIGYALLKFSALPMAFIPKSQTLSALKALGPEFERLMLPLMTLRLVTIGVQVIISIALAVTSIRFLSGRPHSTAQFTVVLYAVAAFNLVMAAFTAWAARNAGGGGGTMALLVGAFLVCTYLLALGVALVFVYLLQRGRHPTGFGAA